MCIKYSISKTIFVIKSQSLLFRIQHFFLKEQKSGSKTKILDWDQVYQNLVFIFQHTLRNNQRLFRKIGVNWFYFSSIVFMNSKQEFLTLSFLLTNICNISNFTKFLNNLYFFRFLFSNFPLFNNQNKYLKKKQTIFPFLFLSKLVFHKLFETICFVLFPIILYKIYEKTRYKSSIVVQSLSYTNTCEFDCSYTNDKDKNQIRQIIQKRLQFDNKNKKLIQKHNLFHNFTNSNAFSLNHALLKQEANSLNQAKIYNYLQSTNHNLNTNLLQIFTNKVFYNANSALNQLKLNSNCVFQEVKIKKNYISIFNLYSRVYKKKQKNFYLFDIQNYNQQHLASVFSNRISFLCLKKSIYNSVYRQCNIVTTYNKFIHNLSPNFVSQIIYQFFKNHYRNKQQAHETYKTICNSYDCLQRIVQKITTKTFVGNNKSFVGILSRLGHKIISVINFQNWKINNFQNSYKIASKNTFETIFTNWYTRVNSKLFEQLLNPNSFVIVLPKMTKMKGPTFKQQRSHLQWLQTWKQYLTQIPLSQTILNSFCFHFVFLSSPFYSVQFPADIKNEQRQKMSWVYVNTTSNNKRNSSYLETTKNVCNDLIQHINNSQFAYQILHFVYESQNLKQLVDSKATNQFFYFGSYNSKLANLLNINGYISETPIFRREINFILKFLKPFHDVWFQKFQFCQSFMCSQTKNQQQINSLFCHFFFKPQTINIYTNQTLTKHLKNLCTLFSNINGKYLSNYSLKKNGIFFENPLLIYKLNDCNNYQHSIKRLALNNNINHSVLFLPLYFQTETLSSKMYELTNWENNILFLNQNRLSSLFQSKVRHKSVIYKNQLSSFYNYTKWNITKYNNSSEISKLFEIYKPWFFTVQFFEIYKPWFLPIQSFLLFKKQAIKVNNIISKQFSDHHHNKLLSLFSFLPNFLNNRNFNTGIFGSFVLKMNKFIYSNHLFFWEQIQTNTYIWKDIWNHVDFQSNFSNEKIVLFMWFSMICFLYYHLLSTFIGSSYLCLWLNFEYNRYLSNPSKNIYKLVRFINKPISLQSNFELNENQLIPNIIMIPYLLIKKFILNILTHKVLVNKITFDIFKTQRNNVVQFLISQHTLLEEIPFINKMKEYGLPFKNSLPTDVNYFRLLNHSFFFSNNHKLFNQNISVHSKRLLYLFYSTNIFNSKFLFQTKQDLQYPFLKPCELSTSSISLELESLLSRAILVIGAKDTGKSYLIKQLASNITTSLIHICRQNLFSIKISQENEDVKQYIRRIKKHILKRIDFIFHLSTILSPSIVWIPSIHEFCIPFVFQKTSIENGFLLRSLISTINSSSNVHFQNKIMFIGSTDNCQQLDPSFLGINIFHKLVHVRIPTSIQRVKNLTTVLQNKQNILKDKFFHVELEPNTMVYTLKDIQGLANEILLINKIQNQRNLSNFTIHVALYRHLYGILNVSIFASENIAYKIGNMFLSSILTNSIYQIQGDIWKTRFSYLSKICIELPIAKSTITEFMILSSIFKYLAGSSFRDIWLLSFRKLQNHMFGLQKEIKHDIKITSELLEYLSHKVMTSDIFNIQYQKSVPFGHYERTYDFNILNKIAFKFETFQHTEGQIVDNEFLTNSFLFTNCHKWNRGNLSKHLKTSNRILYFDFWTNTSVFNKTQLEYTKKDTLKNYVFFSLFKQNEHKSKSFLPNMVLSKKEPYKKRKIKPIFDKQLQMRTSFFEENGIQEFLDFQKTDTINDNYFYFFLNKVKIESKKTIPLYFPEYLFDNFIQTYDAKNTFQSLNFVYCKYKYPNKNTLLNCDSTQKLHAIVGEVYFYLLTLFTY